VDEPTQRLKSDPAEATFSPDTSDIVWKQSHFNL
jgi:hypothetical protein